MPHPACKVHRQPLATEVLRGQRYKYSPNHPHPQAFLMHFSSTIHIFSSTRAGNREKSRGLFAPKQKCSRQTGGDYRDKKRSALHQPSHRTASPYAARCASHRTALRQPSHRTALYERKAVPTGEIPHPAPPQAWSYRKNTPLYINKETFGLPKATICKVLQKKMHRDSHHSI